MTIAVKEYDPDIIGWPNTLVDKADYDALEAKCRELESALRGVMGIIGCECDCIYSDESNPTQCPCKQARSALETKVDDGPKFGGWNPEL